MPYRERHPPLLLIERGAAGRQALAGSPSGRFRAHGSGDRQAGSDPVPARETRSEDQSVGTIARTCRRADAILNCCPRSVLNATVFLRRTSLLDRFGPFDTRSRNYCSLARADGRSRPEAVIADRVDEGLVGRFRPYTEDQLKCAVGGRPDPRLAAPVILDVGEYDTAGVLRPSPDLFDDVRFGAIGELHHLGAFGVGHLEFVQSGLQAANENPPIAFVDAHAFM